MTTTTPSAAWLALREPADAAARARELVGEARQRLAGRSRITVHDLGCGAGSMGRWLAPRLPGSQHWVLHDRAADLLDPAIRHPPSGAADGAPVTVEARQGDVTRLGAGQLAGADLITASAVLDVLSGDELLRLVDSCVRADCPALLTLSVIGRVELTPSDVLDTVIDGAFNAHQRRETARGRLLGPDAVRVAADRFRLRGMQVLVRSSPWVFGADDGALLIQWFEGWVAAACEQQPSLASPTRGYFERRLNEIAAGRLRVVVHHHDLLATP
jgi:hypothetical protein